MATGSHPTRVRGLKWAVFLFCKKHKVAPYTGAWIEIADFDTKCKRRRVAPYTGAWIEIACFRRGRGTPGVAPDYDGRNELSF